LVTNRPRVTIFDQFRIAILVLDQGLTGFLRSP
jgi:hypothetical protein